MNKLKNLSFENITVTKFKDKLFGDKISLKVMNNSEILSEVIGTEMSLNNFVSSNFYHEIIKPELHYVFDNVLSEEDKRWVDSRDIYLKDYIKFLNNKYNEFEDELETLNNLFKAYDNLINCSLNNNENNNDTYCFVLDSIRTKYDGTGAGTLLINYLKENYNLIYLYSIMEIESYFKNKLDFNEIINGFLYWTDKEELKKTLNTI